MRTRILVIGGLCLLAALGAVWFYMTFESVPYKERVGPSSEVRLRPFLAAQRFAERYRFVTGEVRSLPALDTLKVSGMLVVPARRQALDPRRLGQIVTWVEQGGHLVAEAELIGVSDPLFVLLGVERSPAPRLDKPLQMELADRKLVLSLQDAMILTPPANVTLLMRAGASDAARLLSYRRGKGVVTVATSLDFARNDRIGANDHAELLFQLMSLSNAPSLQVFQRPERLSLWGFLRQHAAEALAAGFVLLALWLWHIAPRFGPVAPDALPARRRLLDHLRASGRYYWANGLRTKLVLAARDAALRRLARAQPDFAVAPQAEKVSRLALLMGISPEEASRFLGAAGPMRGADFIKLARHAQRAHAALEKGKK